MEPWPGKIHAGENKVVRCHGADGREQYSRTGATEATPAMSKSMADGTMQRPPARGARGFESIRPARGQELYSYLVWKPLMI